MHSPLQTDHFRVVGRQEGGHSFASDWVDIVMYDGGGCQSRLLDGMDEAGVNLDELWWLDVLDIGSSVVIVYSAFEYDFGL